MKRTPMPPRTKPLRSTKRLAPVSARRRKRDAPYSDARQAVYDRARGMCEALVADGCTTACEQVHHLAGRGGLDPHRLDNLLGVCGACHLWIETNREQAYAVGFLVRRNGKAAA